MSTKLYKSIQGKYINYNCIEEGGASGLGLVSSAVIALSVGAAKATYAPKHSVDYLNETQEEFNSTKCQQDREQRDVPFHNVLGFNAGRPCGFIQKVVSLCLGQAVVPVALQIHAFGSFCQTQGSHDDAVARSCDSNERSHD